MAPKYLRYFSWDMTESLWKSLTPSETQRIGSVFWILGLSFGKCPSNGMAKLIVDFTDEVAKHHTHDVGLLDVVEAFAYLDRDAFRAHEPASQKAYILELFRGAFDSLADLYGWDKAHCLRVCQQMQASRFVFEEWRAKPVRNRTNGMSAQFHVRYEDDGEISVGVLDKAKQLVRKRQILADVEGIGTIDHYCGALQWIDERTVRISFKNERDYWDYDIIADSLEFHFPRAEKGDAHGQYDLARICLAGYLTPRDVGRAMALLRASAGQNFKRAKDLLLELEQE